MLKAHIISENGDKIEEILHDFLISRNLTISTAESCTGGELSHLITSVSGSSNYFLGEFAPIKRRKNGDFRCFRRFNQRKNGSFSRSCASDEFGLSAII